MKKHKTLHAAEADEDGKVLVLCETCKWRDLIDVNGIPYLDAMTAIFDARDKHEAEAKEKGK